MHSNDGFNTTGTQQAAPTALAEELEDLQRRLAEGLQDATDPGMRRVLSSCPEAMGRVRTALRSIEALFQGSSADVVRQRERQVGYIISNFGEGIRDLGERNQSLGESVAARRDEIEAIAAMPPGPEAIARLRTVASGMQEAATKMAGSLEAMAVAAESTGERLASLAAEAAKHAEPEFYDETTRLHTRAALDERIENNVLKGSTWCFVRIGIDHVESVTKEFGHVVADALLFKIARIVERTIKQKSREAFVARYDGASFAILLLGTLSHACDVAERVREGVASARWQYRGKAEDAVLRTTVSLGVAAFHRGEMVSSLLQRAEEAARQARQEGGDRVFCVGD